MSAELNHAFLRAAEVDEIFARTIRPILEPAGFVAVSPRKWVDSSRPPIRPMFEIQTLKGMLYSPLWGVSLDFVPQASGRSVGWHRTTRSARLDILYDPVDAPWEFPGRFYMSSLKGRVAFEQEVDQAIFAATSLAATFWKRAERESDLLEVFEYLRARRTERFGFYNYLPHPLAFAFTLARAGQGDRAQQEFTKYLAMANPHEKAVARLQELLDRATT